MAQSKPKTKMKATKPAAKAKGKPVAKAKAKPAAKKVVAKKPAAPAKKGLLKTAGKLAGKALAALSKADKEKMKKEAAKEKERLKKEAAKAKAEAQKEKERAKKEAEKLKLEAAKEKERAKKEAEKAKLEAAKEKERAKKEAEKAKIQAAKDAEKAKIVAAKEAEKAAKLKAKEDEKAAKLKAKEDAKRRARGEEVEDEEVPRARKGDDDDDEEDFKRVAAKGKGGRKFDEDGAHDLERGYKKFTVNELEGKIADEISELREHFQWKEILGAISSLDFFIDPKDDSCVEKGCDNIRTTQSWCRLHYLKNWKSIQRKKEILAEGKLQEYIEELISKYPPKYIEAIIGDLSDDKEFYKVLNELNITNEFDFEEEDFESADNDADDGDDIGIEATFTGSMRYEDTE